MDEIQSKIQSYSEKYSQEKLANKMHEKGFNIHTLTEEQFAEIKKEVLEDESKKDYSFENADPKDIREFCDYLVRDELWK